MIKKLSILSLAGLLFLSFYMTSCSAVNDNDRKERILRLQETLKIIRAEKDPEFVKRLSQINELLDEISRNSYGFEITGGPYISDHKEILWEKTRILIENPDIALPLMFEQLENKKLLQPARNFPKDYTLLNIYFIVFEKIKSAESVPYIADYFASVISEEETRYFSFRYALWAAQEITSLKLTDENHTIADPITFFDHRLDMANKLNQWYEEYKKSVSQKKK